MIVQVIAGLLLAASLTIGVEFVHGLHDSWSGAVERFGKLEPTVLVIGVVVVWALIGLIHVLTKRLWVAAAIVTILAIVVGAADLLKMEFRGEPLYLADTTYLTEIGFLIENVGPGKGWAIVVGLLAIPLGFWGIARSGPVQRLKPEPMRNRRGAAATRVLVGAVALGILAAAGTFNWPGSPARALYEAAGAKWTPWNQSQNYNDNGVIAGLLYTLPADAMDEPAGYSEQAMADLVEKYSAVADGLNATRDPDALKDANIVVVLSESFSDPLSLPGVTAAEDPIPFTRQLMATNTSGTLMSAGYGGGTSNVEFEVLTGMALANMRPQVDSPFQSVISIADSFPSYVGAFGGEERETFAVHPYAGNFYSREDVYPALGFDEYRFWDQMVGRMKLPGDGYISDAAMYDEVVEKLRESDRPVFVNAVSMQNHNPQEGLSDPIPVEAEGLTPEQAETAGQYLRGLKHSDDALKELVAELDGFDEPTIVLVYGDHLPGALWPSAVFEEAGNSSRYETPWVVYANFETERVQPGIVGANQLMNQVIDAAGAEHTPWTALLHEFAQELPAMERTGWLDASGERTGEDQLSARARELLADYRMAQYDMVAGERYAASSLYATEG